ncbi:MAG: carboxypeptidase-like regulatory domain-containing protein [Pyrinomonadaceae bacterium]
MHRNRITKTSGMIALCCGLLFAFATAHEVFAQTGGVKGKIRTTRGDGIGGVEITARRDGKDIRSVRSKSKGEFILDGLGPGLYNFVFDAPGYNSGIRYNVEVRNNKTNDLGDRLVLIVDKGTLVIVQGSVFYKDGTSVPGAKVLVEKLEPDGTTRDITTLFTNLYGEFVFRQPEGKAKFRITAKYKDVSASKDIEVDSAAIYRLAVSLNTARENK